MRCQPHRDIAATRFRADDFAIRRELDSILYYHEIKKLVPAAQHGTIEQIIDEERKHYSILSAMKKKIA